MTNSNLGRHDARLPLVGALPECGTSRCLNLETHEQYGLQRYEDLLVRELPGLTERTFWVALGPKVIGGLSMDGFGALRIGMKYPERFAPI